MKPELDMLAIGSTDAIVSLLSVYNWIIICPPIVANGPYTHVCCYDDGFVLIALYNGLVYPPFHSEFEISTLLTVFGVLYGMSM